MERCILVGEWRATRRRGGDSSHATLQGDAQVGPLAGSFVARAFSWLSPYSKAGDPCHFFPGSAHPFLLAREESQEDHSPQLGASSA